MWKALLSTVEQLLSTKSQSRQNLEDEMLLPWRNQKMSVDTPGFHSFIGNLLNFYVFFSCFLLFCFFYPPVAVE